MNATVKIDFEPSLFGESTPEIIEPAPVRNKPKKSIAGKVTLIIGGLIGLAVVLVIANSAETSESPLRSNIERNFSAISTPSTASALLQPVRAQLVSNFQPSGWCDGGETICSTTVTSKPAETLKKLIAAIPQGKAKSYRIRLSITPIDDSYEVEP